LPDPDRLPPHDLQAELSVLGSIGLDNACLTGVRGILHVKDFYHPDHQMIFQAMCDLADAGGPIDLTTLNTRLTASGQIERIGGWLELCHLMEQTPSAANVESYAQTVAEKAGRRREIAAATHVLHLGYDLTSTAEERAEAIRALAMAGQVPNSQFDLVADCTAAEHELFEASAGSIWGTGNSVLDTAIEGFMVGSCMIIGGRSQHCKTALACNFALTTMISGGRVVMFRYEERKALIYRRLASLISNVPYGGVRHAEDMNKLAFIEALRAIGTQYGHLLRVYVGMPPDMIPGILDKEKPCMVIYDTLQAMATQFPLVKRGDKPDRDIAHHSGQIRKLATDERFPHQAITISQLTKDVVGLPMLRQLRQSGSIEEDADTILFSWWPWAETQQEGTQPELVIKVAKARETGCKKNYGVHIEPGTQKLGEYLGAERTNKIIEENGCARKKGKWGTWGGGANDEF